MFTAIKAFFSGFSLYAYLAIGALILGLMGTVAYLWEVHKADTATLALDKRNAQILTDALKQSEADKAVLARKAQELDSAIQERDSRLKALNDAKRKLADELDRIKKTVPAQDQSCLDRGLPPALLDLLHNGPAGSHQDGTGDGAGKPSSAVPQV